MKKLSLLSIYLIFVSFAEAQQRVITTGVPFLMVASDARSAGLADQGVATSSDAFSQQYNPAKYAFGLHKQGFSVSYTPYLTDLVNDVSLGQFTYFNKLNERSAFAGSLRYFSLGEIQLTDNSGTLLNTVSPNEYALDGSYSLKLSEKFAMSIAARFITSNLKVSTGVEDASAASTFAIDVAGFFQSEEIAFNEFNGRWRAGFNLQNLGPKISYDNTEFNGNFLPANLKLGTGFDFILDDYNKVAVSLELNKLLVPTPKTAIDTNNDGDFDDPEDITNEEQNAINSTTSWTSGMFKSFGDAPDGFSEELQEITYSLGAEYLYQDSFAMRLGYFHESPQKGARQFVSLGAGFKYTAIKVDVSYLFSASKVRNPLENTLRFSLTFNFGDKYDEY